MGKAYLEAAYKSAFEVEFKNNGVGYEREKRYEIIYKDHKIGDYYADFIVWDKIILEVKASGDNVDEHIKQTLNYLAASGYKLGIIINFGDDKVKFKRVVL
ncbi:MAG TPA: GxxExxY protein [Flavobacteriales bacterium]|nr:GxxExxY protein [Flavobacteriales bacterium]